MTGSDDLATLAYAGLQTLLAAAVSESPSVKHTYLSLALRTALQPQLSAFRSDPLKALNGKYLSLDSQVAALEAAVMAPTDPMESVGVVGGALYLPGSGTAITCRVQTAYLRSQPCNHWDKPIAVHSVSPDLEAAANVAFHAALHVLLFVCPDGLPPEPAPIFWGVEDIEDAILEATVGESLQLPLSLAFLSTLTGLSIPSASGATGAIQFPDRVVRVGFLEAKRQAFQNRWGNGAQFLTVDDGDCVAQIATKLGEDWQKRFSSRNVPTIATSNLRGCYTFVWAEVENAPVLWATTAGDFRAALLQYENLFVAAMNRHRGEPFALRSGSAEGMGAVFDTVEGAVLASLNLLRSVRSAIWKQELGNPLPIRIGIHRGEGEPFRETWRGAGPAQAIRIAQAASGGQILSDEAVLVPRENCEWIAYGSHRLRDSILPVPLWQITVPDLPTVDIAPASLETSRHNLPVPESPLIGREAELDALVALTQQKRLITLTGPGGVGKTRLAVAAAARTLLDRDRFADGAYYIPLDAVANNEAIIARLLCEATSVRRVRDLATKQLLIIFDNAEGVVSIVTPLIQSLLADCPHLTIVITSRRPLRLREEKRYIVAPLALPKNITDDPDWSNASAVRLFMESARRVEDTFTVVRDEERTVLSRLLHRLDGLPLAIELAAARTRFISLSEIDKRLADSLRLLSTLDRNVPKRHQTLLATLEWSYDLLSEKEKALLRRMSVFVGGFDAMAAEEVMRGDPETIDVLASLEEQSLLVRHNPTEKGEVRFSLLQTIADFASQKLRDHSEDRAAQGVHANYFLKLADRYGGKKTTRTNREAQAFDILERDMANLRASWNYFQRVGAQESCAMFGANLCDFLRRRGYTTEHLEWIEKSLTYFVTPSIQQRLLHSRVHGLMEAGREAEAESGAQSLQMLSEGDPDTDVRADALALRGTVATRFKRFADAERWFDMAEKLYLDSGNQQGIATICNNRAVNALRQGEKERAWELSEQAQRLCQAIGDEHGEAYAHNNMGQMKSELGDYLVAERHFRHQLMYCRSNRDTLGCAVSLFNIGEALLHQELVEGLSLLIAGTELLSRLGHSYAGPAQTTVKTMAEKTKTAQSTLDALRRAATRRTLAELRESPLLAFSGDSRRGSPRREPYADI